MKPFAPAAAMRVHAVGVVVISFLALGGNARAQFNAAAFLASTYDDNSWAFHDKRADVYHQLFAAFSYDIGGDYVFLQPFWYSGAALFRTYDTRSYHQHTAGIYIQWQVDFHTADTDEEAEDNGEEIGGEEMEEESDEEERLHDGERAGGMPHRASPWDGGETGSCVPASTSTGEAFSDSLVTYLIVKPVVAARFDEPVFAFYDFRRASVSAMLRKHVSGPLMARAEYEFAFKQYPSFVQFTHLENDGSLTLSARVGQATELFCFTEYGVKRYTETVHDTVFIETGNSGKGKGGVKPKKKIVSEFSTPSASQVVFGGGAVLNIAASNSLTLSVLRRINPSNTARYVDQRGLAAATEDDFFEDRYGYEADEAVATFRAGIMPRLAMETELAAARRRYPRSAASLDGDDLPGFPQRKDERFTAQVLLATPVLMRADGTALLTAGAGYHFTRNASNDAYHDYNIHRVWVEVEIGL
ncbi:MAG: hypothetical protein QHI48_02305 [Bacteroidota bacterium]|nr:hypothetical protein [Bacteroidota bacterium]